MMHEDGMLFQQGVMAWSVLKLLAAVYNVEQQHAAA